MEWCLLPPPRRRKHLSPTSQACRQAASDSSTPLPLGLPEATGRSTLYHCTHTGSHTNVLTQMFTHTHAYTHMQCPYTHISFTYTSSHMHTYLHILTYAYTHMLIKYAPTHKLTHTHTHSGLHTHIQTHMLTHNVHSKTYFTIRNLSPERVGVFPPAPATHEEPGIWASVGLSPQEDTRASVRFCWH